MNAAEPSCVACSAATTICPSHLQVVTWTAIQSFQLGGHQCIPRCKSSCSIVSEQWPLRLPSMSVRQVIVLHPYTQYELHRPSILNIWLIFGDGVKRPGHLDRWPLFLGTGAQCQPWHGQTSCQFWCFCDFSLLRYGQTYIRLTTWPYYIAVFFNFMSP